MKRIINEIEKEIEDLKKIEYVLKQLNVPVYGTKLTLRIKLLLLII